MPPTGFFDCPTEIRDEILSHLPIGNPPTLQGLQLGLTCKSLYEILGPVIVKAQVERLLEATKTYKLQFYRVEPSPTSHPHAVRVEFGSEGCASHWRSVGASYYSPYRDAAIYHLFHRSDLEYDFGITYRVTSKDEISSAVEMWCLHSLLSRSQRFRCIRLSLQGAQFRIEEGKTVGCEWTRAFLKLLEVCAQQPGMEITFTDASSTSRMGGFTRFGRLFTQEGTVHPKPSTVLSSISSSLQKFRRKPSSMNTTQSQPVLQPTDFVFPSETFTQSQLSLLKLSGGGLFSPSCYPFLHHLILQSSSTLTRLHLNLCTLLPDDWRAMLSCWKFSQLSHLSIRESTVPFTVLVSFLRCHPTLTNVHLWVHEVDARSTTALIDEELLPNVRQMVASPSLLIPILSCALSSSFGSTVFGKKSEIFPLLEDLELSQEHDFLRGRHAALKFEDMSKVLSLIAGRRCNTTLPKLHTLSVRTVYQAQAAFEGWLRGVIGSGATAESSSSSSSSSSPSAAAYASYPISNLPLRGIPEFHISAFPSRYYDKSVDLCMEPSMNVDPDLVVDFVGRLFGDGRSTGLKKIVLSDIFTGCSSIRVDGGKVIWREADKIPPAIERIWEKCGDLEEVRCLGFARLDLKVEKVWERPTGPP